MRIVIAVTMVFFAQLAIADKDYRVIDLPSIGFEVLLTDNACGLAKLPTQDGMEASSAVYFDTGLAKPSPIRACWITNKKDPENIAICREDTISGFSCDMFSRDKIRIYKKGRLDSVVGADKEHYYRAEYITCSILKGSLNEVIEAAKIKGAMVNIEISALGNGNGNGRSVAILHQGQERGVVLFDHKTDCIEYTVLRNKMHERRNERIAP